MALCTRDLRGPLPPTTDHMLREPGLPTIRPRSRDAERWPIPRTILLVVGLSLSLWAAIFALIALLLG